MAEKFTKAPWHVGAFIDKAVIPIYHYHQEPGAISSPLAKVVARKSWEDEAWANAHLIASAPSMFDALEMAKSYIHTLPVQNSKSFTSIMKVINGALEKARGE